MSLVNRKQLEKMANVRFRVQEDEYVAILDALEEYHNMSENTVVEKYLKLKDINSLTDTYIDTYKKSGRNKALKKFKEYLVTEILELKNSNLTPVEKNLHFIWIGGQINDTAINYINQWKDVNSDYNVNVFYDSNAFLINTLKKTIIESASNDTLESFRENLNDPEFNHTAFFRKRMQIIYDKQQNFINYYKVQKEENPDLIIDDIVKTYLSNEYSKDIDELNAYIEESLNKVTENSGNDVRNFEEFKTGEVFNLYEQELVERWNLAGASDILRVAILKNIGGVYLDVDMLPGIHPDLFKDINKPDSVKTAVDWEEMQLEAIMKYKEYIPEYTSKHFDTLDEEVQSSFESVLASKSDKSEIFLPLGDIEVSPLEVKIAFAKGSIINQALISAKDSYCSDLLIKQIQNRYKILNDTLGPIISQGNDFNTTMNNFGESLGAIANEENISFIAKIGSYLRVGFYPEANTTITLSGPTIYAGAYKDLLTFKEMSIDTSILSSELRNFEFPKVNISQATEQEKNSLWQFNEERAKIQFEEYKKNYFEGALGEDDNLDFSQNTVTDKEYLLEKISSSTKSSERGYVHYIVQLQGDKISYEAACNLFAKNPYDSILFQKNIEDSEVAYYYNPTDSEIQEIDKYRIPDRISDRPKIKLTLIGHGKAEFNTDIFAGLDVDSLSSEIETIIDLAKADISPKSIEINLLGCNMFSYSVNVEETYPGKLLLRVKDKISELMPSISQDSIIVSANQYEVRINSEGRRELLDHSGEWINKEESIIKDISSKEYISFNPKENKIIVKSKNLPELSTLLQEIRNNSNSSDIELEEKVMLAECEINVISNIDTQVVEERIEEAKSLTSDSINYIKNEFKLIESISDALYDLKQQNELEESHFISFEDISETDEGFSIRFIDKETGESIFVETEKAIFSEYANHITEEISKLKDTIFDTVNGKLVKKVNLDATHEVNTLNAAFFIQSLIEYNSSKESLSNLSVAMKVQVYAQLFSTGLNTITDAAKVVELVSTALDETIDLLPTLSEGLPVIATIIDGVSLGAAIKELSETSDPLLRQEIEAKIGIMAVNLTAATTAIITSSLGIASGFSILLVPLAGISAGIPSLVNNELILRDKATKVVDYFSHISLAESEGAFTSLDDKIMMPQDDLVISEIDFNNNSITLGKCEIWRMEGGSGHTVTNDIDHFFSSPSITYREPHLSIYDVLEVKKEELDLSKDLMVLPNAPNRVFGWETGWTPGLRSLENDGTKLLDRIRDQYEGQFYWRFLAFIADALITTLKPRYEDTNVRINLDSNTRSFIVPIITTEYIREKLSYSFYGSGGTYALSLSQYNMNINIELNENDTWVIDVDNVVRDVTIESDKIKKGDLIENILSKLSIEDNKIILDNHEINFSGTLNGGNGFVSLTFSILEGINAVIEVDLLSKSYKVLISGELKTLMANSNSVQQKIDYIGLNSELQKNIPYSFMDDKGKENGFINCSTKEGLFVSELSDVVLISKVYMDDSKPSFGYYSNNLKDVKVITKDNVNILTGYYLKDDIKISLSLTLQDEKTIKLNSVHLDESGVAEILKFMNRKGSTNTSDSLMSFLESMNIKSIFVNFLQSNIKFILDANFIISGTTSIGQFEFICDKDNNIQPYFIKFNTLETKYTLYVGNRQNMIVEPNYDLDDSGDISSTVINFSQKYLYGIDSCVNKVIISPNIYTDEINITPIYEANNTYPEVIVLDTNYISEKINININDLSIRYVWSNDGSDFILMSTDEENKVSQVKIRFTNVFKGNTISDKISFNFSDKQDVSINKIISTFTPSYYVEGLLNYDLGLISLYNEKFYINNFGMMVSGLVYINDSLYYFKPPIKNLITGFTTIGDDKYYFNPDNGGAASVGETIIDGKNYYFSQNGVLQTGVFSTEDGFKYFAPADTLDENLEGEAIDFTGKLTIDENVYYFGDNYRAAIEWQTLDDEVYYFSTDTGRAFKGLNQIGDDKFYFNSDGIMQKGFVNINDKTFYFDDSGVMKSGYTEIDGKYFYFAENGEMQIGVFNTADGFKYFAHHDEDLGNEEGEALSYSGILNFNNKIYYFDDSFTAVVGWKDLEDGSKYYFDEDTAEAYIGISIINDGKYYFNDSGIMQIGFVTINNEVFYFSDSGIVESGMQNIDDNYFYIDENGLVQIGVFDTSDGYKYFAPANTVNDNIYGQAVEYSGLVRVGEDVYYFGETYTIETGWIYDMENESDKYYFDPETKKAYKGINVIDDIKYYFDENGIMRTGLITFEDNHYYFNEDGIMQYGYLNIEDKTFYFSEDGIMQIGVFNTPDGFKYFAHQNTLDENFEGESINYTGWLDLDEKRYYFTDEYIAATGSVIIDGEEYYFDPDTAQLVISE
ncbi:glycosylating toxin TcdB [Clostridioides difficile]|uniref:glycosylating toxin TcdB n=1 Tax=Clostridioides difficile TaxID=1496 RepID=UPI000D1E687D|nr:glycosylating toxin TcdB [Clostridioides difficile]MBF9870676.1 glycosylating toxin TcdB [Clostridioides difficile]MBY1217786.1 glycosylating toxin TcdB [Clostridioides difficile]MBZ1031558.1 glycosylating toxin TcdB [Clostridioides difficile]MCA0854028.1 glycosylating toxin TcdB [Clostridioides difficile]MCA0876553.1 glycosylating toxin TcdB [Clostridioides difficile]